MAVRGMGNKILKINRYAVIKLYIDGNINGKPARVSLFMEIHLVNELKPNLLIKIKTFKFQKVMIYYDRNTIIFGFCKNFIIFVDVHTIFLIRNARSKPNRG